MNRSVAAVRRAVVEAVGELWGLVVDDGFVAAGALATIGLAYLLSRDGAIGPVDAVGWILALLLVACQFVSVRRTVLGRRRKG